MSTPTDTVPGIRKGSILDQLQDVPSGDRVSDMLSMLFAGMTLLGATFKSASTAAAFCGVINTALDSIGIEDNGAGTHVAEAMAKHPREDDTPLYVLIDRERFAESVRKGLALFAEITATLEIKSPKVGQELVDVYYAFGDALGLPRTAADVLTAPEQYPNVRI